MSWLREAEARYHFKWHRKRALLDPDAYCLWASGLEEISFFLEWDKGTESIFRLSQKLQRYEWYHSAQAYQDRLGEIGLRPRVLIVVPDERRERKIASWMGSRLGKGEYGSLPWSLLHLGRRRCTTSWGRSGAVHAVISGQC